MMDHYARRHRRRTLLTLAGMAAAALLGWGLASKAHAMVPFYGHVEVIDGDTIRMRETTIRLEGIDAPEIAQRCRDARGREWRCGVAATRKLKQLIGGQRVLCAPSSKDDYGRVLSACAVEGKVWLNQTMVREGLAWAFTRYSESYVAQEREARAAKRGVFAAENVTPWDFRAGRWEGAQAAASADRARTCPIKGNISGDERIYHMPWQRDYAGVKVDERRGERWFCNESEAERAGWRRAAR